MAMRIAIALLFVLFVSSALAGELPKEGKFSGQYYSSGTYVTAALGKDGKDGYVNGFDEVGESVGTGLMDRMSWHCLGSFGVLSGNARYSGMCIGTDQGGDQIVANFIQTGASVPTSDKTWPGTNTFLAGTGKYQGITGAFSYLLHPYEFQAGATDHRYFGFNTYEGSYKLP
jgi:hypothetical protein